MQAEVAPSGERKRITEDTGTLQTKGGRAGCKCKEQRGLECGALQKPDARVHDALVDALVESGTWSLETCHGYI
eukprot:4322600-Prymnesium_polylepis.1